MKAPDLSRKTPKAHIDDKYISTPNAIGEFRAIFRARNMFSIPSATNEIAHAIFRI